VQNAPPAASSRTANSAYPVQSAEAVGANSAPYFRLRFAYVVAATPALEKPVQKVKIFSAYKFFHIFILLKIKIFMQKILKFYFKACVIYYNMV